MITINKALYTLALLASLLTSANAYANEPTVYEVTVNKPLAHVYDRMKVSFEQSRFYIFYEMDIGKNLAYFAEKWGDGYNQNNVSAVRSIVFCNGWFLNRAGNKDPKILGLCPMHISLIERDGKTTVLYARPTVTYSNSPAYDVVVEIEKEVIELINNGAKRY